MKIMYIQPISIKMLQHLSYHHQKHEISTKMCVLHQHKNVYQINTRMYVYTTKTPSIGVLSHNCLTFYVYFFI